MAETGSYCLCVLAPENVIMHRQQAFKTVAQTTTPPHEIPPHTHQDGYVKTRKIASVGEDVETLERHTLLLGT